MNLTVSALKLINLRAFQESFLRVIEWDPPLSFLAWGHAITFNVISVIFKGKNRERGFACHGKRIRLDGSELATKAFSSIILVIKLLPGNY